MRYAWVINIFLIFILITGCSETIKDTKGPLVFFPEPPDPPRIQFLTSFTGARDIEPPKSAFERFITGEKDDVRRLDKPYGVAIHDGRIYVCDTNAGVIIFDLKNRRYEFLKGAIGQGKLIQPVNISIDEKGNKYVTDPLRKQVVVFDRNDLYVRSYGIIEDWKPVDAVPFGDELYVADIKNGEIKVLDILTGEINRTFGRKGDPTEWLDRPTNLVFDKEGILYVSDAGRFQIVKFDRDGHLKGTIGRLGVNLGHFARPRGVAVDREGRVFVVDAAFFNVQVFNRDGFLLMFFGGGGTAPGKLVLPAEVVVDYDNIDYFRQYAAPDFELEYVVIVTSQFGDRMVNVYGFGKQKGLKYLTDQELLEQVKKKQQEFFEKQKTPDSKGDNQE